MCKRWLYSKIVHLLDNSFFKKYLITVQACDLSLQLNLSLKFTSAAQMKHSLETYKIINFCPAQSRMEVKANPVPTPDTCLIFSML